MLTLFPAERALNLPAELVVQGPIYLVAMFCHSVSALTRSREHLKAHILHSKEDLTSLWMTNGFGPAVILGRSGDLARVPISGSHS